MSILHVLPMMREFNQDKGSIHDKSKPYELSKEETEKLHKILAALVKLNLPYIVDFKICRGSGYLYFHCRDKPKVAPMQKREMSKLALPPISGDAKKV